METMRLDATKRVGQPAHAAWAGKGQSIRESCESPANLRLTTAIAMVLLMTAGPAPCVSRAGRLIHRKRSGIPSGLWLPLTAAIRESQTERDSCSGEQESREIIIPRAEGMEGEAEIRESRNRRSLATCAIAML